VLLVTRVRADPAALDPSPRGEVAEAGVEPWTPHLLRHSFATRVRRQFGLDAARAALGHAGAQVTLDYAELDWRTAEQVARRLG